ncbi:Flagellar motor switch protein FliM [Buchnera aphidicola (Cinara piceae)]|uniref:Flagellar motor switch protein FliM n=1 Tax=Buchnera aphidicola (Cinara piceae) TaxID=1660043 RepID=A0A803FTC6_9GAMM|nr:hypothetical protein [Buchnera aphidicola]VFP87880.1 Flagellar motor switch protein FliM [Buchnera aphidicola (Cinara piceae)]
MLLKKYIPAYIYIKNRKSHFISLKSDFLFKFSKEKTLNRINFLNLIFKKKKFFFKIFFNDFCVLFKKEFRKFFSFYVDLDFLESYIEYNDKNMNYIYANYIGKQFCLNNYTDKCLFLLKSNFFSIFINYFFGNYTCNLYKNDKNINLNKNEINIVNILFERIFLIFNKTFLKNISTSVINNFKYITINNCLCSHFFNLSYVSFVFQINLNKVISILKIYIPINIVEKFIN